MPLSLLAAAWSVSGFHPRVLGLLVLAAILPPPAAVLLSGVAVAALWLRRAPTAEPIDEHRFCAGVGSELSAGASLRHAVRTACEASGSRSLVETGKRAADGAPLREVAEALSDALPLSGRHVAFAMLVAAESGGGAASTFFRLAQRASVVAELQRERRALSAQARLSALVVGSIPVAAMVVLFASGRAGLLLRSSEAGTAVLSVGLALVGAGLGTIFVMVRRAPQ